MHDTQLTHAIATDAHLRTRIDSVIKRRTAAGGPTAIERLMLAAAPLDPIAWDVACNPSILSTVRGALGNEDPQVAPAIATITDSDLEYVVLQQLTCLQD